MHLCRAAWNFGQSRHTTRERIILIGYHGHDFWHPSSTFVVQKSVLNMWNSWRLPGGAGPRLLQPRVHTLSPFPWPSPSSPWRFRIVVVCVCVFTCVCVCVFLHVCVYEQASCMALMTCDLLQACRLLCSPLLCPDVWGPRLPRVSCGWCVYLALRSDLSLSQCWRFLLWNLLWRWSWLETFLFTCKC